MPPTLLNNPIPLRSCDFGRLKALLQPILSAPLIACAEEDRPGEGMVDFDGDASARLQRTDPPIAVRSDGLRYAPRADARFARHTHLLTPR